MCVRGLTPGSAWRNERREGRATRYCDAMKLLALCGSLRAASINAALLRAFARLAPGGVGAHIFPSRVLLPLFSPDRGAAPPPAVRALHAAVAEADGLV